MFSHPDDIQPRLIGKDRHIDHLTHPLARRRKTPGAGIGDQVAEGVEAEFQLNQFQDWLDRARSIWLDTDLWKNSAQTCIALRRGRRLSFSRRTIPGNVDYTDDAREGRINS